MTESDKQLLIELNYGIISRDTFIKRFSVDLQNEIDFVETEINAAIESNDQDEIQMVLPLIWLSSKQSSFTGLLNELLVNPNHQSHQQIAKALQDLPNPSTVPFVRKALETNFDYLEYTCSDSAAIAKWFSWLLYSIGTDEAIDLIKEYCNSPDEGIANEMKYRLGKIAV